MKPVIKKALSIALAIVICLSTVFAVVSNAEDEKFEAEEYFSDTIVKLLNGEEICGEIYDKPIVYDLSVIARLSENHSYLFDADAHTDFESDRKDYPTHQRICASALAVILHDKGVSAFNDAFVAETPKEDVVAGSIETVADFLVYHAGSPDENEQGAYQGVDEETGMAKYSSIGGTNMFYGHFYDPYTELNFRGVSDQTAKLNARRHYDCAVNLYRQANYTAAYEELGRAIHYVQDACQSHHANNVTAVADGDGIASYYYGLLGENRHSIFEKDIDTYIRNHLPYVSQLNESADIFDDSIYNEALEISIENIVRNNCYSSYVLLDKCDYATVRDNNNVDYYDSIIACYKNGVISTVQFLYHFADDVGITFTK